MFSGITKLVPTGAYGRACWQSFIFEVTWNISCVMIVSGRLPNRARKRARTARGHPGDEVKCSLWSQEGSQPCQGVLSPSASCRGAARVGREPGRRGTVLAGHESGSDTARLCCPHHGGRGGGDIWATRPPASLHLP